MKMKGDERKKELENNGGEWVNEDVKEKEEIIKHQEGNKEG